MRDGHILFVIPAKAGIDLDTCEKLGFSLCGNDNEGKPYARGDSSLDLLNIQKQRPELSSRIQRECSRRIEILLLSSRASVTEPCISV